MAVPNGPIDLSTPPLPYASSLAFSLRLLVPVALGFLKIIEWLLYWYFFPPKKKKKVYIFSQKMTVQA